MPPVPAAVPAALKPLSCACLQLRGLAQSSDGILPVFGWSLVLIALLVAGFFAIAKLRQWLKEDSDVPTGPSAGFTLSDLRQLHRQGKMTDEEFERARAKMVGAAKAMAAEMPDPLAREERKRPER